MISLVPKADFILRRRDPQLLHAVYHTEAQDLLLRIPKASTRLADPEWMKARDDAALLRLTGARAEYALDLLALSYSAGAHVADLARAYPDLLGYFEEYARRSEALNATPIGRNHPAPHIALADVEFERANRLLCFAILLGWQEQIPRVMASLDYNNRRRDGMLERLAGYYMPRPAPPANCLRGLPYSRILPIFDAPEEARAELMRDYLTGWYEASRNEPYYGSAGQPWFHGYWSWEAAAITHLLGIDDSAYRDLPCYPRDLVTHSAHLRATGHAT